MLTHRFSLSCIRIAFIAGVFASALIPCALRAAEAPAQVKGAWGVTMMENEKKAFGYCLARAPYSNGLQLAIALSPKKEVNVGVVVPDAGFNTGDKYPMTVAVDSGFKRSHPGIAAQPQLLMVPLGSDKEILGVLQKGKVLSIEGPEDTAYFSLKGSGKALTDLQRCVDVGTGKVKPQAGAAAAGPMADAKSSGKAPKFPPGLLQLLKASGLKDLQLVEIPDPTKAPVDFAWRTQGVLGGLRERPVPDDVTLEKMSAMIEDGYKKQCTGTFDNKMGEPETLPGVTLRKADLACTMGGQLAHVSLLLYITDTHLFSMFMHEAHGADKPKAIAARDAITAQIRKLAKVQHSSGAEPAASKAAPAAEPAPSIMKAPSAPASGPWANPEAAPSALAPAAAPAPAATQAPAPAATPPAAAPAPSTAPKELPSAPPPAVKSSSDAVPPPAVSTDKK